MRPAGHLSCRSEAFGTDARSGWGDTVHVAESEPSLPMLRQRPRPQRRDAPRARKTVARRRGHRTGPGGAPETIAQLLAPPKDPLRAMREENYEPALEHEVESRFAVSNGVLGVRASLEHPTRASWPRSYAGRCLPRRHRARSGDGRRHRLRLRHVQRHDRRDPPRSDPRSQRLPGPRRATLLRRGNGRRI
jgi:hypothetical protein